MNGMINAERFCWFVSEFVKTVNQEKEDELDWQFFLHKVYDKSFAEFKKDIESNKEIKNMPKKTIETTVSDSMNILKNFKPD